MAHLKLSKGWNVAHMLALPHKSRVHPTFHVSYLKPYHEDLLDKSRMKAGVPL